MNNIYICLAEKDFIFLIRPLSTPVYFCSKNKSPPRRLLWFNCKLKGYWRFGPFMCDLYNAMDVSFRIVIHL